MLVMANSMQEPHSWQLTSQEFSIQGPDLQLRSEPAYGELKATKNLSAMEKDVQYPLYYFLISQYASMRVDTLAYF